MLEDLAKPLILISIPNVGTHMVHLFATYIRPFRLLHAVIQSCDNHQLRHHTSMSSRLETPPRLPPTQRSQWRFFPVEAPTEWVKDYRPGKSHPVHLGDEFKNGRYKVLRKLGYGAHSTVWLARDKQYDLHFRSHP